MSSKRHTPPAEQQCCLPFGIKLSNSRGRGGILQPLMENNVTVRPCTHIFTLDLFSCPPNQHDLESHAQRRKPEEWGQS